MRKFSLALALAAMAVFSWRGVVFRAAGAGHDVAGKRGVGTGKPVQQDVRSQSGGDR